MPIGDGLTADANPETSWRRHLDGMLRHKSLLIDFIERLWRISKTEEIDLKDYGTVPDLSAGTDDWFDFYNTERPHWSLRRRTPLECHEAPNEFGAKEAGWHDPEAIRAFWD
jgi:transposase InsO family protein